MDLYQRQPARVEPDSQRTFLFYPSDTDGTGNAGTGVSLENWAMDSGDNFVMDSGDNYVFEVQQ